MAISTTEGIIIKRSNFGEADRILTVVTPFKGKIRIVAKGVRRITSRRGGNVELLNKVKMQIFQNKGLPILTEAESIETYQKIKSDLLLSSYGSHIAELMDRLLPDEQLNPTAYQLLASILGLLDSNPRQIFIRAFEVKLLSALGFWSVRQIEASSEIKNILDKMQQNSWSEIEKMEINKNQALELERILRYYIEKILESSLRSVKIIDQLKTKNGQE
jgi:DNA repair protein RecO (recombination protein O)